MLYISLGATADEGSIEVRPSSMLRLEYEDYETLVIVRN